MEKIQKVIPDTDVSWPASFHAEVPQTFINSQLTAGAFAN